MNKEALKREINDKVRLIDQALDRYLPGEQVKPGTIHEAMRYSVFAGGKRLRPVLFLASAEAVGGNSGAILPAACALELIHTYSLIHDDLPAMDNDDFRRGKPTSHKVYGEAIAVLTGDALLTLAFDLIAGCGQAGVSPNVVVRTIKEISGAAGTLGMIGGQVVDIQSENRSIDKDVLDYIHSHKTGALFRASVRAGALMGGGSNRQIDLLTEYAENLGLAFQITDDILDVEGNPEKLGKTVGSDIRKKKCTYPALYGLQESKELARNCVDRAILALKNFGAKADILRYIARYVLNREN
ncbi:MAG: polyprenyl synthetase family protein [Eubacteriales bacterium]